MIYENTITAETENIKRFGQPFPAIAGEMELSEYEAYLKNVDTSELLKNVGSIAWFSQQFYEDVLFMGIYFGVLGMEEVSMQMLGPCYKMEKVFLANGVPESQIKQLQKNAELRVAILEAN